MDKSVEVSAAEPAQATKARGGWTSWEPGDDLCPTWWPRRPRSSRGLLGGGEALVDLRAADRVYAALTLLASSFQFSDDTLARELRVVALSHLRDGAEVLARGAARTWEPGDDVCPPWPWGRHVPWPATSAAAAGDAHGPRRERAGAPAMPGRAADLLDGLNLLQAYTLAAKFVDPRARETATMAIGRALLDHADLVARAFV